MNSFRLYVSVPVASFRVAQAREFWESYACPPPSTIYGMLLSVVGEPNRFAHQGADIAVALLSEPERSVVLRTLWRVKDRKSPPGFGNNKRPDFQELLSDICLSIWVRHGESEASETALVHRLQAALREPETVSRSGGLSLGESPHLVNEVRSWRDGDPSSGRVLLQDHKGDMSLPVWPDHVGSKDTVWGQFRLDDYRLLKGDPPEEAWVTICPPQTA